MKRRDQNADKEEQRTERKEGKTEEREEVTESKELQGEIESREILVVVREDVEETDSDS